MLPLRKPRPSLPFRYSHRHMLRLCLLIPFFMVCTSLLVMVPVYGRFDLLRSPSFWSVAGTEVILLVILRQALKTQTRLTIDEKGIDFRFGRAAHTYQWTEIDGVRSIVAGRRKRVRVVEILLKGQETSATDHPNWIYCKAVEVDDLTRLINEGRLRWAVA